MRPIKATTALGLLGKNTCTCGALYHADHARDTIWCEGGCTWSRGSGFDVLAEHLGDFEAAVAAVGTLEPWVARSKGLAKSLRLQRDFLEFILRTSKRPADTMELIGVREAFQASCRCRPAGVIYLDRSDVRTLILLLAQLGADIPPGLHDRGAGIVTYWVSPCEVSALRVLPRGARVMSVVVVRPSRYSWSGLHLVGRTCTQVDVYPEFLDSVSVQDVYQTTLIRTAPVSPLCLPMHALEAARVGDLRFVNLTAEWEVCLPKWSHIQGFEEATFTCHPMEPSTDIRGVLKQLFSELEPDALLYLLGNMRLSEGLRLWIRENTQEHPASVKIAQCVSRVLMEQADGVTLYRAIDGYEIEENKESRLVSNFTVDLKAIIGFERLNEIYYEAAVTMKGDTRILEIPGRSLDQVSAFEAAIRTGQIFNAPAQGNASIEDPKGMARILKWLRLSTQDLPRFRGYKTLGWTNQQDYFILPSFAVAGAATVENTRYKPVVDSDFFPFAAIEQPEKPDVTAIDPRQADVVSALISCVIRSYFGLPFRLLPVINNSEGRTTLTEMFRELGQQAPVRLTAVMQKHVDTVRGYPCLVANIPEAPAAGLSMCGVRYAEKGRSLSGSGKQAGKALCWALTQVTRGLMAGEDIGFKEKRSVSLPNSFAQEGQEVLQNLFGSWPEAGAEWKTLDHFLLTRGHDLEHKSHVCFEDDTVILHKEILEGVDVQDLTIELGLLCRRVQQFEETLVVDRNTLFPVLEDFYGTLPKIKLVRVTA